MAFHSFLWCCTFVGAVVNADTRSQKIHDTPDFSVITAYDLIRGSFPERLEGGYSKCTITDEESCPISAMPLDQTTVVYPGGEARCIFDSSISGEYAFQVIPGNSSKGLLFYFQGGGACWDETSTNEGLCTTTAEPSKGVGVFDRTNMDNPFRDWTVVQVLYCSGDVHSGNSVRPYNDSTGYPVTQTGWANTQSVLDWVLKQPALVGVEQLLLAGQSAGAMGVQTWASPALEQLTALEYQSAAVVPDSFIGYFPPSTEETMISGFGYCDLPIISEELVEPCKEGKLMFKQIVADSLGRNPTTPYAYINSKEDAVQIGYYVSIAEGFPNVSNVITPSSYYDGINAILQEYVADYDNVVVYMIASAMHTYTPDSFMYTADASGLSGGDSDFEPLIDFLASLPLASGDSIEGACDGSLHEIGDPLAISTTYCLKELDGVTFVQQ